MIPPDWQTVYIHKAHARADTARNVPGEVLDKVPANGGDVMVTFAHEHVSIKRKNATTMNIGLDLLFCIAERFDWNYIGLGSDFKGFSSVIPALEDAKCHPVLMTAILGARCYSGASEEVYFQERSASMEWSCQNQ